MTATVQEPTYEVTVEETPIPEITITIAGPREPTAHLLVWSNPDIIVARPGDGRMRFPINATIGGVSAVVGAAPVGADIILDVHKNDVTIWTDQSKRIRILNGETEAEEVTDIDVASLVVGDTLTIDIDQVGSTSPGHDLTVVIRYHVS